MNDLGLVFTIETPEMYPLLPLFLRVRPLCEPRQIEHLPLAGGLARRVLGCPDFGVPGHSQLQRPYLNGTAVQTFGICTSCYFSDVVCDIGAIQMDIELFE